MLRGVTPTTTKDGQQVQRKGGPRSRSRNEDRFKGTLTGVPIPEAARGSDGIELFDDLIDRGYDEHPPNEPGKSTKSRPSRGAARAQEKYIEEQNRPSGSRSRGAPPLGDNSALPNSRPSIRNDEVELMAIPSPHANNSRLQPSLSITAPSFRNRSPSSYDPHLTMAYASVRNSQTFGSLSRYQDDNPDVDEVMNQYVDLDGGLQPDDESSPPAPVVSSPKRPPAALESRVPRPPLVTRTPVGHNQAASTSTNAIANSRGAMPPTPPMDYPVDDIPERVSSPIANALSKGKGKAIPDEEEPDSDGPLLPAKRKGKERIDDDVDSEHEHFDFGEPQFDDGNFADDVDDDADANHDSPQRPQSPPHTEDEDDEEREARLIKEKKPKRKKDEKPSSKKRPRDGEEEPLPKKKKKAPVSRADSVVSIPYIEELVEPSDDEEEVRRSRRAKIKPIRFWLGEKVEYAPWQAGTGRQTPLIAGIRRVPEVPTMPLRKRKPQPKGRSRSRKLASEEPEALLVGNPEDGWDEETDPMGIVLDFDTNAEVQRRIAFTSAMVVPKGTQKGLFGFQKIFSDKQFVAAGQLVIPKGGNKPKKSSKDNTYVFYLIEGAVRVNVHDNYFLLAPGGMFMVPRGNYYYIENVAARESKLFFAQGRMMSADDATSRGGTARAESMFPGEHPGDVSGSGRRRSMSRVNGYGDSGDFSNSNSSPRKRHPSQPLVTPRRR